jgi:hypothetical protein
MRAQHHRCFSCGQRASRLDRELCVWCTRVGAASPIADEQRRVGRLSHLARATRVQERQLRRAAVGEGVLEVGQALRVALALGVEVDALSLGHAAERAKTRRAAARRKASDGEA